MSRRGNKYRAIKTEVDGIVFDSRSEARRFRVLKLLEKAGEITGLECQPKFRLEVNGVLIQTYKADFAYTLKHNGERVVEDVKSKPTAAKLTFIRTKKLMKAVHGIDVQVVFA